MPFDWNELRDKLPAMKAEHDRLGKLIALLEGEDIVVEVNMGDTDAVSADTGRSTSRTPSAGVPAIGRDDFVNMSTSEAIKAFLAKMGRGRPQGPREMAQALIDGGRGDTDFDTAYANVASSLKRLKKNDEIVQVRRGEWGLASWYNNRPRGETDD